MCVGVVVSPARGRSSGASLFAHSKRRGANSDRQRSRTSLGSGEPDAPAHRHDVARRYPNSARRAHLRGTRSAAPPSARPSRILSRSSTAARRPRRSRSALTIAILPLPRDRPSSTGRLRPASRPRSPRPSPAPSRAPPRARRPSLRPSSPRPRARRRARSRARADSPRRPRSPPPLWSSSTRRLCGTCTGSSPAARWARSPPCSSRIEALAKKRVTTCSCTRASGF